MIKFYVTGAQRKKLVQKLAALTGQKAEYMGLPSMAFKVGNYTIDKTGMIDGTLPDNILRALKRAGFTAEIYEDPEVTESGELVPPGFIVEIPMDDLTDEAVDNFYNMLESKASLIKRAFNLKTLPVDYGENTLTIKWFEDAELPIETKSYVNIFISAMLDKAKSQKYVISKPLKTDNPKYNFRIFLNSLGLSGSEYKGLRKEFLKNLKGCSNTRHPAPKRKRRFSPRTS